MIWQFRSRADMLRRCAEMTRDDAIKLNHLYARIGADLDQSIRFRMDRDPNYENSGGALPTAKVMGEMLTELMNPLWNEFPDLLPKQMDGQYEIPQEVYDNPFYNSEGSEPQPSE